MTEEIKENPPNQPDSTENEQTKKEQNTNSSNSDLEKSGTIQSPPKSNAVRNIIIAVICILAIYIVISIIRSLRRPMQIDLPIPYIFNTDFYNFLNNFVEQPIHKEILLIHGPSGIGKTRGLNHFIEKLNEQNRLVFHFDFKVFSQYTSLDDFIHYLKTSIINSFTRFQGYQTSNGDPKLIASYIESHATIDGPLLSIIQQFRDSNNQKIVNSLITIIERIRQNPKNSLAVFFSCLEELSVYRPVLIINNLNNLAHSNCIQIRQFRKAFWKVSGLYADDFQTLPIIIEVSNETTLIDEAIPRSLDKLRTYRVDEFSDSEARSILVKGKIFTKKVYQIISEKVGHHGQSFATIYDMVKEGVEPQIACERLYDHTKNLLRRIIETNVEFGTRNNKLLFIKQLSSSNILPLSFNSAVSAELLKWKAITLVNQTHCTFPNKLIKDAANELLSTLR